MNERLKESEEMGRLAAEFSRKIVSGQCSNLGPLEYEARDIRLHY
jgi:hypothetical protein